MPKQIDPEAEALVIAFAKDGLSRRTICKNIKLNGFNISRIGVDRILRNEGKNRQARNAGLNKPIRTRRNIKRTPELIAKVTLLVKQDNPPTQKAMADMFGVDRYTIKRLIEQDLKLKGNGGVSKSGPVYLPIGTIGTEDELDEINFDETPATPCTQFDDQPSKVCLLCSSICVEVKDEVISFFLEQLMCVSVEELQKKFVALKDSLMENLSLCGTCIAFVKDAERIYAEWKIIKEKIKEIENEIKTKLQQRELSQDMFQENTTLFQLYEDIRSNRDSKKEEMPSISSTKNIASFYDLGMDVPEFVSTTNQTHSTYFDETIKHELETEVKIENIEVEESDWDVGVIESVTGMMESDDELEPDSSPIHKRDDDDWVPTDDSLDNELSPSDEDDSSSNSKKVKSKAKTTKSSLNRRKRKSKKVSNKRPRKSYCGTGKRRIPKLLIKCTLCKETFEDKATVIEHFRSEHNSNCKFHRQEIINDEIGISCVVSEYCADDDSSKEKATLSTQISLPFPCPETNCSKTFLTERARNIHAVHVHKHQKITSYDCELCDYKTKHKYQLKFHKMTHTGEKPELCSYCGVTYRRKETLADHIRTKHTLEKPFTCQFCEESFAVLDNMYKHMRKIHPEWSSSKLSRKTKGSVKTPVDKAIAPKKKKKKTKESDNGLLPAVDSTQATIYNMDSENVFDSSHREIEGIETSLKSNSNEVFQTDWSFYCPNT